jgi:PKD domain
MLTRRRSFALALTASVFATTAAAQALTVSDKPSVVTSPEFVVPTAVHQGDTVGFASSGTGPAMARPTAAYVWDFGDGTAAAGPKVEHSYSRAGNYTVKLVATSAGGNVSSLSQTVEVVGPSGQPVATPIAPPRAASTSNPRAARDAAASAPLSVRLLLLPQGLNTALRSGIAVNVTSNAPVDGFASVLISRKAANRAGIKASSAARVMIGMGTITGLRTGTKSLRLHLSQAVSAKLERLQRVTLTIRLAVVAASGDRVTVGAAGHY